MRRTIQLTGVDGATGVGTFSCNLPMNLDYFGFYAIDLAAAVVLADIPNVNLYAQGETLRQYNGIQQGILNTFDKLPAYTVDSCLSIHLDQLGMKTVQATYAEPGPGDGQEQHHGPPGSHHQQRRPRAQLAALR